MPSGCLNGFEHMALSALPLFHRVAGERIVVVGEGPMGDAKTRLVERAGAIAVSEAEAHHARLAFVALEDEGEAIAAARRLKAKGLLVNVADRPALCDFTVPSLLDRDPVLVAVGTAGASAGLAKHLRLRLEALLPQSLGRLAAALRDARPAMRRRWTDASARRAALDHALAEGGDLDPLDGASSGRVERWLTQESAARSIAQHEIILRSDDPDDLTLRQARLLGQADAIVAPEDLAAPILDRARADAERFRPGDRLPERAAGIVVRLRRA